MLVHMLVVPAFIPTGEPGRELKYQMAFSQSPKERTKKSNDVPNLPSGVVMPQPLLSLIKYPTPKLAKLHSSSEDIEIALAVETPLDCVRDTQNLRYLLTFNSLSKYARTSKLSSFLRYILPSQKDSNRRIVSLKTRNSFMVSLRWSLSKLST